MSEAWYRQVLACPDCGEALVGPLRQLACPRCGVEVPATTGPIDLRPRSNRSRQLELATVFDASPLAGEVRVDQPASIYSGPTAIRDSSELFSALLATRDGEGDLLDLGCGPGDQRTVAEHCAYRYLGVDIDSKDADLLGDAHALPLASESFDVVLGYAVLEHLHNPFMALAEVNRILRPGGLMLGTVSQGEPFHASYFHHTLWGLLSVAQATHFDPVWIWPSRDTLLALATMAGYPRAIRWLLLAVSTIDRNVPLLSPRKWFRGSPRERQLDRCHRAGSLCFLLRRR